MDLHRLQREQLEREHMRLRHEAKESHHRGFLQVMSKMRSQVEQIAAEMRRRDEEARRLVERQLDERQEQQMKTLSLALKESERRELELERRRLEEQRAKEEAERQRKAAEEKKRLEEFEKKAKEQEEEARQKKAEEEKVLQTVRLEQERQKEEKQVR
jgi:hypothetical protein